MKYFPHPCLSGIASLSLLLAACTAQGELVNWYVAIDGSSTEPSWSAYRDLDGDGAADIELANPNEGRLTFLYAHDIEEDPSQNHFHTIGRYAYTGDVDSPVASPENQYSFWFEGTLFQGLPGNLIPEQLSDFGEVTPPLPLLPSDGVYDGKLTSIPGGEAGGTYANMEIRPATDLASYDPGTPEHIMLYALEPFGEDYDDPMTGAVVAIELLDLTPGLNIGSLTQTSILANAGDTAAIGAGDSFSFTPVFWTDSDAAIGVYSATMRLVDLRPNGAEAFLPSGQYTFSFAVVPEPSTLMLAGAAVAWLVGNSRRAAGRS